MISTKLQKLLILQLITRNFHHFGLEYYCKMCKFLAFDIHIKFMQSGIKKTSSCF